MPWNLFPTKRPTISKTTIDLLFLLGLMILFYGNPFLNPTVTSYGGDGFSLFLPSLDLYRQAVYNGVIPLWNPYTWGGAPFLAPYQSAALYPPQLISLAFSSVTGALNFGIFLSILWLAFGSYIFGVRALELERFPSLLMAIAISCSGFIGAHTDHVNQLAAVSWIPWIMSEALILLRWPKLKSVALLAICIGMQILAGHPQYVTYTFGYLVALAVCYFVYYYHRRRTDDPPAWLGLALLVVAVILGFGLGAAQLLPSFELSKMSIRQIDAPERMFSFSYPPRHLVTMFFPNAFGNPVSGLHDLFTHGKEYSYNFAEFTSYIGLVTMVLAILGTLTLFQEFPVRAFFLLALLSLIGAFGEYVWRGIPYQTVMMMLPGGDHLRAPARFLFFLTFSLSVLAAMGFNQVFFYLQERRRIRPSTLYPLRFLILVLVLFDLFLFSKNQIFRHPGPTTILSDKGPSWRFFEENPGDYRVFRQMLEVPYTADQNKLALYREERDIFTRLQYKRLQPNLNMLAHVPTSLGYEEGLLPTLAYLNSIGEDFATNMMGRYHRNLYNPNPDTVFMGLLNIKYVLADKPVYSDRLKMIMAGADVKSGREYIGQQIQDKEREMREIQEEMASQKSEEALHSLQKEVEGLRQEAASLNFENSGGLLRYVIYENLDYLPKFNRGRQLRALYNLDAMSVPFDRAQDLIPREGAEGNPNYENVSLDYRLPNSTSTLTHQEIASKPLSYVRFLGSPNGYMVQRNPAEEGEIIMSEAAYPGWVCRWGNRVEPMRPVNASMMASPVLPRGVKQFRVQYEPFSFRIGLFISCLFAMIVSAAAVFSRYPHTHRPWAKKSEPRKLRSDAE